MAYQHKLISEFNKIMVDFEPDHKNKEIRMSDDFLKEKQIMILQEDKIN